MKGTTEKLSSLEYTVDNERVLTELNEKLTVRAPSPSETHTRIPPESRYYRTGEF